MSTDTQPLSPRVGALNTGAMKGFLSKHHLLSQVNPMRGDLVLLACCFVTGMLDCAIFNNYNVFVGMQTGNGVILCLSTARLPSDQPYSYALTLTSLVSFFIGGLVTARLSNHFGPLRRVVLTSNFLCQTVMIVIAAAVTSAGLIPIDNHDEADILGDPLIIGAIPALAFQSGATIVSSRLLGYGNEIPVNVLTSTYGALAADPNLFKLDNKPRNRRIAAVFFVLGGAMCATWIMRRGPGIILVLWICAGLKLIISTCILLFLDEKLD